MTQRKWIIGNIPPAFSKSDKASIPPSVTNFLSQIIFGQHITPKLYLSLPSVIFSLEKDPGAPVGRSGPGGTFGVTIGVYERDLVLNLSFEIKGSFDIEVYRESLDALTLTQPGAWGKKCGYKQIDFITIREESTPGITSQTILYKKSGFDKYAEAIRHVYPEYSDLDVATYNCEENDYNRDFVGTCNNVRELDSENYSGIISINENNYPGIVKHYVSFNAFVPDLETNSIRMVDMVNHVITTYAKKDIPLSL